MKKFQLVEVYKGIEAGFYSIKIDDSEYSLFDEFVNKFQNSHSAIIDSITSRIAEMADEKGIRASRFKDEGEKGVEAFVGTGELRLYCLRFGNVALILGSGDTKPQGIDRYQEKDDLFKQVKILRALHDALTYYNIDVDNIEESLNIDFEINL